MAAAVAVGVVLAVAVLAGAAARLRNMSLEMAEHRGRLAAQAPLRPQPPGPAGRDPPPPPPGRRGTRARPWIHHGQRAPSPPDRHPGPGPADQVPGKGSGAAAVADSGAAGESGVGKARGGRAGGRQSGRPAGRAGSGGLLAGLRSGTSAAVRRRGLHSVCGGRRRRLLRVGGLGIVAGFAAGGAWKGTTHWSWWPGRPCSWPPSNASSRWPRRWTIRPAGQLPRPARPVAIASLAVPTVVLAVATAVASASPPPARCPGGAMLVVVIPATRRRVAGARQPGARTGQRPELMSRYPVPEARDPSSWPARASPPAWPIAGVAAAPGRRRRST